MKLSVKREAQACLTWGPVNVQADGGLGQRLFSEPYFGPQAFKKQKKHRCEEINEDKDRLGAAEAGQDEKWRDQRR